MTKLNSSILELDMSYRFDRNTKIGGDNEKRKFILGKDKPIHSLELFNVLFL